MSLSNTNPHNNAQRPTQHSPLLTAPKPYRPRPIQNHPNKGGNPTSTRSHHHNASITSNPSQSSQDIQQFGGDQDFWLGNQQAYPAAVASPGTFQDSTEIYHFDEDASHHEPSFDDFWTTENSSENPLSEHTTPQEQIWEQQFILKDTSQPHILDTYSPSAYDAAPGVSGSSELQSILQHTDETLPKFVSGEELLGSRLNTSSGSAGHLPTDSQIIVPPQAQAMDYPASSVHQQRATSQTLKVDTTPNHTPSPNHKVGDWQRTSSTMRAPSPVVMVSSYESSGLELETVASLVPGPGKRGRGSEGYEEEEEDDTESRDVEDYSSHLMPPDIDDAGTSHRVGLEPHSRNDDAILSVKDLEEQRQREERNAEVQTWLATSEAGSEAEDDSPPDTPRKSSQQGRQRAHTTGTQVDGLGQVYPEKHLPGPGVLVDVETDDEYFDDVSISSSDIKDHTEQVVEDYLQSGSPHLSPHTLNGRESSEKTAFPTLEDDDLAELQEPLPNQFIRRGPWQDTVRGPISNSRDQPGSSNAAAYKFNQEAAKWETASRAATWGTRRRLSESEICSIVEGSQVRHLSLSKRGRDRTSSILNKARGLLPRRSNSNIKQEPAIEENETAAPMGHAHRSSVGSVKPVQRKSSFNKPKSPSLSAGSAFMAMAGQLAAVGGGNSMAPEAEAPKPSRTLPSLRKQRSKSDVSKNAKTSSPGLAELMTRHGGPPIPTLASPMHEREPICAAQVIDSEDAPAEDDDDDLADEVAIKMDLEIRAEDITPTVEGFKDHARKLNPRLEPYLIERIGQEQIRRYKKLVEAKIKHARSVQVVKKCSSGKFCFELGGDATLLAPRVSSKDPETTLTQFQVSNLGGDDEIDESAFTEGVVTPALFPAGIPLPPVKRLPAEYECNLCFKVKKFQKPSDWTKHVHEDIQPFSCTFPNCTESKSFKRKADWVRHENERHRHLEWWKCGFQECSHICYRKDNFVQHLVREHKMSEPKVKGRGSGSSKHKAVNNGAYPEDSEVWRMVEECRFETQSKARDEPCRFCGNVCSSFKKLSVHMGKHMEQIAMPVLQLVSMRQVSPDTIISPIEQPQTMSSAFGVIPAPMNHVDASNLSPYPTSAASAYQTSSAGQSPASMHGRPQHGGFHYDPGYYSPLAMTPVTQGQMMTASYNSVGNYAPQPRIYGMGPLDYMGSNDPGPQHEHNLSPQNPMVAPRSQPMGTPFGNPYFETGAPDYGTRAPMHGMYAGTHGHSHSHSTPGFMGQYAPSMLAGPNHPPGGHSSSPVGVDDQAGLGLTPPRQHVSYVYGPPDNGEAGPSMQYSG